MVLDFATGSEISNREDERVQFQQLIVHLAVVTVFIFHFLFGHLNDLDIVARRYYVQYMGQEA